MTDAASIQQLLDREAIVAVALRYCSSVDTQNWARLASCFTPDAHWFSPVHSARGHIEIMRVAEEVVSRLDAVHHVTTNTEVSTDGTNGSMRSCYVATHVRGADIFTIGGVYHDTLKKIDGAWLLDSREFTIVWQTGNPQVIRP